MPQQPESTSLTSKPAHESAATVGAVPTIDFWWQCPWSSARRATPFFHGHCHQKALAGTAATVALLERIPGAEVTELDAGCCGMAGSFGFEAEHYELSMQIGEQRLFPALRDAAPGALVAATGVSCRQQIGHGVGQRAWHPVELVRSCV